LRAYQTLFRIVFSLLLPAGLCGGCVRISDKPSSGSTAPRPQTREDSNVTIEVRPNPNRVGSSVQLQWLNEGPQTIKRITSDGDSIVIAQDQKRSFRDPRPPTGETVSYLISDNSSDVTLSSGPVFIPRDLEIDSPLTATEFAILAQGLEINRLFLRSHAEITTWGQDLKIDVADLIAEGALIQTFPSANPTTFTAGKIVLQATHSEGHLTVDLVGKQPQLVLDLPKDLQIQWKSPLPSYDPTGEVCSVHSRGLEKLSCVPISQTDQ